MERNAIDTLNNYKTYEIMLLINEFRHLTLKTASRNELRKRLEAAVPVYIFGHQIVSQPELYRIRKNESPFTSSGDFWNPPAYKANIGRLNRKNESILYVSLDPVTPFHEAKIKTGDKFTLIFYKYKSSKRLFALLLEGLPMKSQSILRELGLSETGLINYNLINDFIRTELIRDVGEGTEYLYDISNIIKDFLDQNNNEMAYIYSSVNNYQHRNCAIKPIYAKDLLLCSGCLFGAFIDYSDKGETAIIKPICKLSDEIDERTKCDYVYYGGETISIRMQNEKSLNL